jgi:imidazolonepropionase-like amidohydrolase
MSKGTDPRAADYSEDELRAAVAAAREKGRDVSAHAHGAEGIRRAARAGVRSVEHASMLDDAAVAAVKESGTFLVPNPYTSVQILSRGKAGGFTDYQIEKSRQVYTLKMESLKRAIREGLPIAYGTDSGVQVHGENAKQLAIFVEAGMTPLQAIRTATTVAARLLRMETRIGRIAKGFAGDLVAVAGNPLENVTTLEAPVFVMKDGKLVLHRTPR